MNYLNNAIDSLNLEGKSDIDKLVSLELYVADHIEYDKTYMYQARGKYDNKHTTHLVITNYPLEA